MRRNQSLSFFLSLVWVLPLVLWPATGCKKDPPPKPAIASISPVEGLTTGGLTVTIMGENFQDASEVSLGGASASNVTVSGDGKTITATTSAHDRGSVSLSVKTPGGTGTKDGAFKYLLPVTLTGMEPSTVTAGRAEAVVLRGTGLVAPVQVTVGEGTTAVNLVAGTGSTDLAVPVQLPATLPTGELTVTATNADNQSATSPVKLTVQPPATPVINRVEPNKGPVTGGTQVRLFGTGLKDPTQVLFGTAPATVQNVDANGTEILVLSPANARGPVNLTVTTAAGSGSLAAGYSYQQPVTISAIEPSFVASNTQTNITIRGTGMVAPCQVRITDNIRVHNLEVLTTTDTALTVQVPALPARDYQLSVINADAFSTSASEPLHVREGLVLSAVHPRAAFTQESIRMEVVGVDLLGATEVQVGGVACQDVDVITSKRVACTLPARATAGKVDIIVNKGTQAQGRLSQAFTFHDPSETTVKVVRMDPPQGRTTGGTQVDLYLTGMGSTAPSVTLGGVAVAGVQRVDNRRVRFTLPAKTLTGGALSQSVPVSVNLAAGSDTDHEGFLYFISPTLTSITPTAGASVGGDLVTVRGTAFSEEHMMVRFGGGLAGHALRVNATELTCHIPPHAPGLVGVVVENEFDASQEYPNAFEYVDAVRITVMDPPHVSIAGGTRVEATGSGFAQGRMRLELVEDGAQPTNLQVLNETTMRFTMPSRVTAGTVTLRVTDTAREGQPFASGDVPVNYVDLTEPVGAVGGGDIRRNISVSVIRADTRDRVPNANVFVGQDWASATYKGITNSKGMLVLAADALDGPVTLTAFLGGYETQTRVAMDAAEVTFALSLINPPAKPTPQVAQLTGEIINWDAAGSLPGVTPANRIKRIAVVYPSHENFSAYPVDIGDGFIISEDGCDVTDDGIPNPLPNRFTVNVVAGSTVSLMAIVYFYDSIDGQCTPWFRSQAHPQERFIGDLVASHMAVRRNIAVSAGTNPAVNLVLDYPVDVYSRVDMVGAPVVPGATTARTVDALFQNSENSWFAFGAPYTGQATVDMGQVVPLAGYLFLPFSLSALANLPTGLPVPDNFDYFVFRGVAGTAMMDIQGNMVGYGPPISQVYKRYVMLGQVQLDGWFDFPVTSAPVPGLRLVNRTFAWNALNRGADATQVEIARVVNWNPNGTPVVERAWMVYLPGNSTGFQLPTLPAPNDLNLLWEYLWQLQGFAIFSEDQFLYNDHTMDLLAEEHWQAHVETRAASFRP